MLVATCGARRRRFCFFVCSALFGNVACQGQAGGMGHGAPYDGARVKIRRR